MIGAMSVDLTTIIVNAISLITISGITSLVVMKYTKKEAKSKANSSENKEQAERIDLGDKYVTQMLNMMEKMQTSFEHNSEKNDNNYNEQKQMFAKFEEKLNDMHDELTSVKDEVTCIVKYLNGGYQKYKYDGASA